MTRSDAQFVAGLLAVAIFNLWLAYILRPNRKFGGA